MRFLCWHVEKFKATLTKKGRSPITEPFQEKEVRLENGLLLMVGVEKEDEKRSEEILEKATKEVLNHSHQLGVSRVVILPFSHLFVKLGKAEAALEILKNFAERLSREGLEVKRVPFGWFNELEIKAKGHPLSRIAREIK